MPKLYGSRISLHTALQAPTAPKFRDAENPDERKTSKRKPKKASVAKALNLTQKGAL